MGLTLDRSHRLGVAAARSSSAARARRSIATAAVSSAGAPLHVPGGVPRAPPRSAGRRAGVAGDLPDPPRGRGRTRQGSCRSSGPRRSRSWYRRAIGAANWHSKACRRDRRGRRAAARPAPDPIAGISSRTSGRSRHRRRGAATPVGLDPSAPRASWTTLSQRSCWDRRARAEKPRIEKFVDPFPAECLLRSTDLTMNALYYVVDDALVHTFVVAGERARRNA